ncbi:hypothetical protein D3C72_663180 [compost metagenome]
MRRDVGRHADGDAGRAVDEQVGEARGQHRRLLGGAVEVGAEVHGVRVDVGHELAGEAAHAGFRITVGRGGVAVDRAEVAVAVHHRVAAGEVLREAHHRVVDRAVAVRVVLAQHVADDRRALAVLAVGGEVVLGHGEENAAVHRLQAVAHVRQRAAHDDAHGVVQVGLLELVTQVDRLNFLEMERG